MSTKTLFIMGNGPSLKEVMDDPKKLEVLRQNDTFGLNAAYRAYDKYDFYPTYFGCFDFVVNESHKSEFENIVLSDNPIKKFFFIGNHELGQKLYRDEVRENPRFQDINFTFIQPTKCAGFAESFDNFTDCGSSGANSTQIGIMLGYKKIVLLGCDCNYVEYVDGAARYDQMNRSILIMTKTPDENPNYWFTDYQQEGDKYHVPNGRKVQMMSWKNIKKYCPDDVSIINCSSISKIWYFDRTTADEYFK